MQFSPDISWIKNRGTYIMYERTTFIVGIFIFLVVVRFLDQPSTRFFSPNCWYTMNTWTLSLGLGYLSSNGCRIINVRTPYLYTADPGILGKTRNIFTYDCNSTVIPRRAWSDIENPFTSSSYRYTIISFENIWKTLRADRRPDYATHHSWSDNAHRPHFRICSIR